MRKRSLFFNLLLISSLVCSRHVRKLRLNHTNRLVLCGKNDFFKIPSFYALKNTLNNFIFHPKNYIFPLSNSFFCWDVLTCPWLSVGVFVAVDVVLFIHLSLLASAFVDSSANGGLDD